MPGPATFTPDHQPASVVFDRSTRAATTIRGPSDLDPWEARELIQTREEEDAG